MPTSVTATLLCKNTIHIDNDGILRVNVNQKWSLTRVKTYLKIFFETRNKIRHKTKLIKIFSWSYKLSHPINTAPGACSPEGFPVLLTDSLALTILVLL